MNKVMLMGRITREVEVRYSAGATPVAVAKYGLAVRRQFVKQGEADVDFFNIVAFGKAGEFAEKYFKKGQMIAVVGRMQVNTWTDEKNVKRTSYDVIAEEQHFAGSKQDNASTTDGGSGYNRPQAEVGMIIEDDDLPF